MISLVDFDINIREPMERIRLATGNNEVNAKTFISGYIWGTPMGIKIHIEEDAFCVRNSSHGESVWNFPVGEGQSKKAILNELIGIKGLKLRLLTKDDVDFLNNHFPDMFTFEEAIDESEYIYDSVEHKEMAGMRFRNLRRTLNKFDREHRTKSVMLRTDSMGIARQIMETWGEQHGSRGELDTSGIEIDEFLLEHYDELGLIGTLTYIDGMPAAVAIGYPLSSDMCDIAEIKFLPTIKHLGYVAAEEFMKAFGNQYRYFNNEEDMGIKGLREYKQCLKPCKMITFWNAYLKENKNA